MKGLSDAAPFINALTLNFATLHALLITYMAMTLVAILLFFRNNEYMVYAIIAMDAIVWMIAVYSVLSRIYAFPNDIMKSLVNATSLLR